MKRYLTRGTNGERKIQMEEFKNGKAEIRDFKVLIPIAGKSIGETISLLASKSSGLPLDRHWYKYAKLGYLEVGVVKEKKVPKKESKTETKSEE